jgi:hypothetical protein
LFPLTNNRIISITHVNDMALSLAATEYSNNATSLLIMRKRDKVRSISEVRERLSDERC